MSPLGINTKESIAGRSYIGAQATADGPWEELTLYAPTAMRLVGIGAEEKLFIGAQQYALTFEVSCEVSIRFDHIDEVTATLSAALQGRDESWIRVEGGPALQPGDLIRYAGRHMPFDFMVDNLVAENDVALGGGDSLEHRICPYDLFAEELRALYFEMLARDSRAPGGDAGW